MEYRSVKEGDIPNILETYFAERPNELLHLIVIGANNGMIEDFLTKYVKKDNTISLMVEPVKHLFNSLQENLKEYKNLLFENSAVYKKNGKKQFYLVQQSDKLPEWTGGLGSFSKTNILSHANQVPLLKSKLIKETVNCITFSALIKKYKFSKINVLQIDVEGYDFELLKTINLQVHRPELIIIEILHITVYEAYSMVDYLVLNNYSVYRNPGSFDFIAKDDLAYL
jgi:FkbM family methyltransferase